MNLIESLLPRRIRRLAHFWSRAQWRRSLYLSEITLGRGAAIRDNHFVSFRCGPHGRVAANVHWLG